MNIQFSGWPPILTIDCFLVIQTQFQTISTLFRNFICNNFFKLINCLCLSCVVMFSGSRFHLVFFFVVCDSKLNIWGVRMLE